MKQMKECAVSGKETAAREIYFAAANSGKGFVSYYAQIFERDGIRKRYILQGGPGTGKSSFMRRIAEHAEGRGMDVVYYSCSSDPDSLDGLILDGRIAILDGTAPHTVDPRFPGARDEIVNLGEFWDGEALGRSYNEIVSLGALKESAYRRAYRFLSAAMEVARVNQELVLPALKEKKMEAAAERLSRIIPKGSGYSLTPALSGSIGMKGVARLNTYERLASRLYIVDDTYGLGAYFLLRMMEIARQGDCAVAVSYQPLMPELPDALLFLDSGICFVLGEGDADRWEGRVNMKRFVSAEALTDIKVEYRVNKRLQDALQTSAVEALSDAGRYHFELERIYVSCMDFDALGKFTRSFCQKIK